MLLVISSPMRTWHTISDRIVAVPELTRSARIQLNERLSLRRPADMLARPKLLAERAHRGIAADG
jgi:hypothetical protein